MTLFNISILRILVLFTKGLDKKNYICSECLIN